LSAGLDNLAKHIENLRKFHLPVVVALNRFPDDTADNIRAITNFCARVGVDAATANVFAEGGQGALNLAAMVTAAADKANLDEVKPLYPAKLGLRDKIETVAKEIYGAASVDYRDEAKKQLDRFSDLGFSDLPVCIAKTQYSLSDNPKKFGAPKDWTLTVTDARLSSGAGFVVAIAGNMVLMPGLPKTPHAVSMNVSEDGIISGLG
jgi:formate--tetrahydrofolate ligase